MLLVPMNEILMTTYICMWGICLTCLILVLNLLGLTTNGMRELMGWYKNIPKLDCDDGYRTLNLLKPLILMSINTYTAKLYAMQSYVSKAIENTVHGLGCNVAQC